MPLFRSVAISVSASTNCRTLEPTFLHKWLQRAKKICRSYLTNCLEPIVIGNVNVRPEVMSGKAQADNQALVSKNLLFISKNGVGELRVKGRESFWLRLARLHYRDLKRIVRVTRPWNPSVSADAPESKERGSSWHRLTFVFKRHVEYATASLESEVRKVQKDDKEARLIASRNSFSIT